jgi:uncharacterized protein with HEPN domain
VSGKNLSERLTDILLRIEEIESFLANKNFETFSGDRQIVRAVERNLEIIGEITRHIPADLKAKYPEVPWQDMIGMRNILAHGYDVILEDALWLTVQDDLGPLAATIKKLIRHL